MKIKFECPFCRLVINTSRPFHRVSATGGSFEVAEDEEPEEGSGEAEDFGFRSTERRRNAKRRIS